MKKLTIILISFLLPVTALAQMSTFQGGTGTTSPSGILYGDSTIRLKTLNIGTGLQFSGGTLTNTVSGGSGVWPFTNDTNYGVTVQSTTTPEWFKNGMMASSTSYFVNASTTALTVSGNSYLGTVSSGIWNGTAIDNAYLANSTISGVALGSNLYALTNDTTLSGSSYNGSAAISDWGINLANPNTWTGGQIFTNSTTTNATTTTLYVSSTGTTTIAGNLDVLGNLQGGKIMTPATIFSSGDATIGGILTASNFVGTSTAVSSFGGSVGIGTTNPSDQLSVSKTTGTSLSIATGLAAGTIGSPLNTDINFRGYQDYISARIRSWDESGSTAYGKLSFWTASSMVSGNGNLVERMRIDQSGNVGIGTTSPRGPIDVYGTGAMTSAYISGSQGADLRIQATNSSYESLVGLFQDDAVGGYRYYGTMLRQGVQGTSNNNFSIVTRAAYNDSTRLTILNSSGYVGIGTTTPATKLGVYNGGISLTDSDFGHSITNWAPAGAYGSLGIYSGTGGGLDIAGVSVNAGVPGTTIDGIIGVADPTDTTPAIYLRAGRLGTGPDAAALANAETVFKLTNLSTDLLTVLGSGNVGIGTTTPGTPLAVNGAGVFTGIVTAPSFNATSTLVASNFPYASSTAITVSGTTFTPNVTSAGNLVLQAQSGSAGFLNMSSGTIASWFNGTFRVDATTASTLPTNGGLVVLGGAGIGGNLNIAGNASTTQLTTTGSTYLATAGGNVGIGTTAPGAMLNVTGNALFGTTTAVVGGASNWLDVGGGTGAEAYINANSLSNSQLRLYLNSRYQGGVIVASAIGSVTLVSTSTIGFSTNSGSSNQVVINSSGYMGIGTTNPQLKLVVSNSGTQGFEINPNGAGISGGVDVIAFNRNTSAYAPMYFDASVYDFNRGNVGIGTTSPSAKLSVTGSGTGATRTFATSDSSNNETFAILDGGTTYVRYGRFGVGTTTPWAQASITNTNDSFPSFIVEDSSSPDSTPFIVDASGNVGIGTTTPGSTLSVHGTAIVSGNTFVGGVITSTSTPSVPLHKAFSYATTTAWTGTTTIPLGPAYDAETWSGVKCFTDVGTLNVSFNDGTNRMNMFNASSTIGTVTLSTNNTFAASETRYVDIGTPATAPTRISCTVKSNN